MKMEISIEEKARRYDEAYKKVAVRFGSNVAEEIFSQFEMSEDERIRKWLIEMVEELMEANPTNTEYNGRCSDAIAWLEKQAEHAKFRDSIQVGDKVTRNRDGMLVNLSQLKRVAKPAENKGTGNPEQSETINSKWFKEHVYPQSQWKPSDEQMNALNYVVNLMASSERPTENDLYYNILKSLKEQLKRLREE